MEKILLVDDSDLVRAYVRVGLKKYGYGVSALGDGSAAYRALIVEKELLSLIIADIDMPNMNGYSFCRKVKNEPLLKMIPIIISTSNNTDWDKQHAKDCGAIDFVPKPFSIEVMVETIKKYI